MVYLETSNHRFWKCERIGTKRELLIRFGKRGFVGHKMKKKGFRKVTDLNKFVEKRVAAKKKIGYLRAREPRKLTPSTPRKKTAATPTKKKATPKKKATHRKKKTTTLKKKKTTPKTKKKATAAVVAEPSTGRSTYTVDVSGGRNDADAEVDSVLRTDYRAVDDSVRVHDGLHAKLVHVDPSTNSDKFYVLQVLVVPARESPRDDVADAASSTAPARYYLLTRWGRTGTRGQSNLEEFAANGADATARFRGVYRAKTGVDWDADADDEVEDVDVDAVRYDHVRRRGPRPDDATASWFYWLTYDPFGKPDGWYEYDEANKRETETLWREFDASVETAGAAAAVSDRLSTRLVHSETSGYTYLVDLRNMTQRNTSSGKVRPVRRSASGGRPEGPPNNN